MYKNPLKKNLSEGKPVSIAWNQLGSPFYSEMCGQAGLDGVMMDLEHSTFGLDVLAQHCMALSGTNCIPMARVPDGNPAFLKRVLDAGVQGVLVPQISTIEEAKQAVAACKYPPHGIRGVCISSRAAGYCHEPYNYIQSANKEIFVALAIETAAAVEILPQILEIEGLDGIFVGAVDLSASMGFLGKPESTEVQNAIKKIIKLVEPSDKYLGCVASDLVALKKCYQEGFRFFTALSDMGVLSKAAYGLSETFKQGL